VDQWVHARVDGSTGRWVFQIRNSNVETRNKLELPKHEIPNGPAGLRQRLRHSSFGHWDLFRISGFVLRILQVCLKAEFGTVDQTLTIKHSGGVTYG
jgi:hypothetical protein